MIRRRVGLLFGCALVVACATGRRDTMVVDTRSLAESSGVPVISDVIDLGGTDVLLDGLVDPHGSDGTIVVGETLWIRGKDFGRQPTVLIAGRPAAVLARTEDAGILVRVPTGCEAGSQSLSVSTRSGETQRPMMLRRYAALLAPGAGQIDWVDVDRRGPATDVVSTPAPGASLLAMSHDGRAAYVTGASGPFVSVFEVPAAGGPRDVFRVEIGTAPVRFLLAADRAPLLLVVREKDLLLFDASSALRPARRQPRPLPESIAQARPVAAAMSPDGRLLLVAVAEGNRVIALDLEKVKRGLDPIVGELAVEPDAHASVLVDLGFSPDGETVWVLAGETAESVTLGPQPARIHAVRVEIRDAGATLTLARTVTIDDAALPRKIVTSRTSPLSSGAAIRLPPERATVFFAATARAGGGSAVLSVGAQDTPVQVATVNGHVGGLAAEPEGRWLLWVLRGDAGDVRMDAGRVDGREGDVPEWAVPGRVSAAPGPLFLAVQP